MFRLDKDIIFVVLQYLIQNNFHESAQKLEQESKVYFNLARFTSMVVSGNWTCVDEYLRSFTKPTDGTNSMMMFWIIDKQKFLEALDEQNIVKAVAIFENVIMPYWKCDGHKHRDLAELLPLKNFRENKAYAQCGDIPTMRANLVRNLTSMFRTNRMFHQILDFPEIKNARLNELIAQSGQWQQFLRGNVLKRRTKDTSNVDRKCELPSSSTPSQQLQGVPARDNGAGPSSTPLATMNLIDLFQK